MEYAAAEAYDKVDPKQLVALRAQHAYGEADHHAKLHYRIGVELITTFDLKGKLIYTDKPVH